MPRMKDEQPPDDALRLIEARIARGFKNPKDAARHFGWVYETYIQHEQGNRGLSKSYKRYAKAFNVDEAWLLTGRGRGPLGDTTMRMIPIVGYVGAGAEVFSIDDHAKGGGLDEIKSPWSELGPDAVAVRVRGNSMAPALHDKDIIIYDEKHTDFRHLVG